MSIGERGDPILDAKLVLVIVAIRKRAKRVASDLLVVRNDGLAAVNVAVGVRARHPLHADGLSIHRQIAVPLRRRFPQLVLERLERIAPVDPLHGGLPSLVEHLPHLATINEKNRVPRRYFENMPAIFYSLF